MINLLPEHYARALYMSDIDGLPQTLVAVKLGLSLSATKMRIQRARKMLYKLFFKCCEIEYSKNGNVINCTIKESCEPLLEFEKILSNLKKNICK